MTDQVTRERLVELIDICDAYNEDHPHENDRDIAQCMRELLSAREDAARWRNVREYRAVGYKIAYLDGSELQVVLWTDKADRAIDAQRAGDV